MLSFEVEVPDTLEGQIQYFIIHKLDVDQTAKGPSESIMTRIAIKLKQFIENIKSMGIPLHGNPGDSDLQRILNTIGIQREEQRSLVANESFAPGDRERLNAIQSDPEAFTEDIFFQLEEQLNRYNLSLIYQVVPEDSRERRQEIRIDSCGITRVPVKAIALFVRVRVEKLWIENNMILALPFFINDISSLISLYAFRNRIRFLPELTVRLRNLVVLHLGNNQIECLPGSISNLANISWLRLSDNNLTSLPPLPDKFKFKKLVSLELAGNHISEVHKSWHSLLKDTNNQALIPSIDNEFDSQPPSPNGWLADAFYGLLGWNLSSSRPQPSILKSFELKSLELKTNPRARASDPLPYQLPAIPPCQFKPRAGSS